MAMPDTPIATNLNETLDIEVNLFSQVTLNYILTVNNLPEAINLVFSEAIRLGISTNTRLSQNPLAQGGTNAIDIL
jgi:hypothetical protein